MCVYNVFKSNIFFVSFLVVMLSILCLTLQISLSTLLFPVLCPAKMALGTLSICFFVLWLLLGSVSGRQPAGAWEGGESGKNSQDIYSRGSCPPKELPVHYLCPSTESRGSCQLILFYSHYLQVGASLPSF